MYWVYVLNWGTAIFGTENESNGPIIHSHFGAIGTNNTTAPATIIVYGGKFIADATPTNNEWWSYFCAPIYAAANWSYTINGGTLEWYYWISSRYSDTDQDILIWNVAINASSNTDVFVDEKTGTTHTPNRNIVSTSNERDLPDWYVWEKQTDASYKLVKVENYVTGPQVENIPIAI